MMKLDDLKQNWKHVIHTDSSPDNLKEMIDMIEQETTKIDREIKRRDILEIGIAILLIPAWIYGIVTSAGTLMTVGCVIAIAACIYIPYRLIAAKKVAPKKSDSIKDFLLQEKQKVLQQKQMLESVFWWYIGPLGLAIFLITLGGTVNESGIPQISSSLVVYYVLVVMLMVGVYFLNKRTAKNKYGPLLENIEKRLSEIS